MPRRKREPDGDDKKNKKKMDIQTGTLVDQPRARRVRGEGGAWVDPRVLEGQTIVHVSARERMRHVMESCTVLGDGHFVVDDKGVLRDACPGAELQYTYGDWDVYDRDNRPVVLPQYTVQEESGDEMHVTRDNPYRLLPPTAAAVPITLQVDSSALMLADMHAHLSTSEIIGLLGGHISDHGVISVSCAQVTVIFR